TPAARRTGNPSARPGPPRPPGRGSRPTRWGRATPALCGIPCHTLASGPGSGQERSDGRPHGRVRWRLHCVSHGRSHTGEMALGRSTWRDGPARDSCRVLPIMKRITRVNTRHWADVPRPPTHPSWVSELPAVADGPDQSMTGPGGRQGARAAPRPVVTIAN